MEEIYIDVIAFEDEPRKLNDLCGVFSKMTSGNDSFKKVRKYCFDKQKEIIKNKENFKRRT